MIHCIFPSRDERAKAQRNGFTLVELLIVIVVIAILASITLVAYTGISVRARNTSRVAVAGELQRGLETAQANTNLSPYLTARNINHDGDTFQSACLGKNLPDLNGDGLGDCVTSGNQSSTYVVVSDNPALDAQIEKIFSIPDSSNYAKEYIPGSGTTYSPFIYIVYLNGSYTTVMEYHLEGTDKDCKLSPLVTYTGGKNYSTTPAGTLNSGFYQPSDNVTLCIIDLGF